MTKNNLRVFPDKFRQLPQEIPEGGRISDEANLNFIPDSKIPT